MTNVIETIWIPLPDGTKLAARLWLPDDGGGSWPTIFEYIPYRRRDRTRLRDDATHSRFAEAGYAAIRVDIRGSGDSDGLLTDEYTETEIQDGVDVIAWIAAQDWCDGKVGMMGKSWGAFNAFQVAARRPPALKAIAPVMGTDDRFYEDIHFYGGVLASDNFWWGAIMQLFNALPPDPDVVGETWRKIWRDRLDAMTFWPATWLEHQTKDAYWRHGSVSETYGDINIPVFYFGGWADLYRDTAFRVAEHLTGPVRVMMGPWAHLYPHEGVPGPQADFVAEVLRFWNTHLKGLDAGLGAKAPLRFYLQGSAPALPQHQSRSGVWVEESCWPTPNVTEAQLWLNNGTLGKTPQAGPEMNICSPQTFGASGGDMMSFAIAGDLPGDPRMDAAGALSFRGAVAKEPRDILGQPSMSLTLAADRPQGFVAALLIDEAPDGSQSVITRGFTNLMHRKSDRTPDPVVPGEEMQIDLSFRAIGHRLATGHRLVVQLASTYWPILWPAPDPVTLTLKPGRSSLSLPIRAADAPLADNPPPPPAVERDVTTLREGKLERTITTDQLTGEVTARTFIDGGVFGPVGRIRLNDTMTELNDTSERIYRIKPDDPLSNHASMTQISEVKRGEWSARIKTTAAMRATATEFHLTASVTCWDGDQLFHNVAWEHVIPRNGM